MKASTEKITYTCPPSSVILVSTIDKKGRKNIAPYGFFSVCDNNPASVMIAMTEGQHTLQNIKETQEFIVGIPTPKIAKSIISAGSLFDSDEFKALRLTPVASEFVKPSRIKECQTNLECKLFKEIKTGAHTVILGRVLNIDIWDELFSEDKEKMRLNLKTIYHVTGHTFKTGNGEIIKV